MGDFNSLILSASVKNAGVKDGKFPYGWMLIEIPEMPFHDLLNPIPSHKLFIGFNLQKDEDKKTILRAKEDGWITVWDATLTSKKIEGENQERRGIQCQLSRAAITKTGSYMNTATLVGKVIDTKGSHWARFSMTYLNPKGEGRDKWQQRYAVIYLPDSRYVLEPGNSYCIIGQVSGQRPDISGDKGKDVIIVAQQINKLR